MALDDIVKVGKSDKKARNLIEDLDRAPARASTSVAQAMADIYGITEEEKIKGLERMYLGNTLPQIAVAANEESKKWKKELIKEVKYEDNYEAAVAKLLEGEEGFGNILSFLVESKPYEFSGSDEIRTAHIIAYEAKQALSDPQKIRDNYKALVDSFESPGIKMLTEFLAENNENLPKNLIVRKYIKATKDFEDALGKNKSTAKTYLDKLWNATADKDNTDELAYRLGQEVVDLASE